MRLINWVQLIVLVILIGTGIGTGILKRQSINDCHTEYYAFVLDKCSIRKNIPSIKYKYIIDGETYYSSESIPNVSDRSKVGVGDSIYIAVSCRNKNISKVLRYD